MSTSDNQAWIDRCGGPATAQAMIPSTAEAHARQVLDKALADYRGGLDVAPWDVGLGLAGSFVDLKDNPDREKVLIQLPELIDVIAQAFSSGAALGAQLTMECVEAFVDAEEPNPCDD